MANVYNELNKYTTSTFQVVESVGDTVLNPGEMVSSGTLTITPDTGRFVSASDFSVTNATELTDPASSNYAHISSIVITDTGTAGTSGNTVLVTVNLATSFVLSADTTINLDIDGSTSAWSEAALETYIPIISVAALDFSDFTFTPLNDFTLNEVTESGITTSALSGQVSPSTPTDIFTLNITTEEGYYFNESPYLVTSGMQTGTLNLSPTAASPVVTRDSSDRITAYNFKGVYTNDHALKANSGADVFLKYSVVQIPTSESVTEIKDVSYGRPQVSHLGENRIIKFFGNYNAEFDVTITKDTDGSSILDTGSVNTSVDTAEYGNLDAINKKIYTIGTNTTGVSSCSLNIPFPTYDATVRTTAINMGSGLSGTDATFDSIADVKVGDRLMMSEISTGTEVTVTALTSGVRCTLSASVTAADDAVAKFTRQEKYHINLYPKPGTTLGSNIPITKPHFTISQYMNPVLTLTATEASANYSLTTYAASTYTGRPNTYPDVLKNTSSVPRTFNINIVATKIGGTTFTTANNPVWSSTKLLNDDGSSATNWTNSLYSTNGGTHLEIFNLKTTRSHTNTVATVTATVLIKKWGTKDVTMNLDLDNILTAS